MRERRALVVGISLILLVAILGNLPVRSATLDKIAYVKDDAIWVMDSDGTGDHQVSSPGLADHDLEPAWSPDGSKIAFARLIWKIPSQSVIMVINSDGTNPQQVTNPTYSSLYESDSWPTWSPDGTKIAFERDIATTSIGVGVGDGGESSAIWVVNADGTNEQQLTSPSEYEWDSQPDWSPDGTKIAFVRQNLPEAAGVGGVGPQCVIWVINADKTNPHQISSSEIILIGDSEPSWSPDGTKIAYTHGLPCVPLAVGALQDSIQAPIGCSIWVMDSAGGNEHQVSMPDTGSDDHSTWSPDGTKIAFARMQPFYAKSGTYGLLPPSFIWVMDSAGGSEHQVSPGNGEMPDWWGPHHRHRPQMPSLLPTVQNHISEGSDLLKQANDLFSQAKTKGVDTAQCEKMINEAKALIDKSKASLANPVYANNIALKAIGELKQAISCLKASLG